MADTASLVVRVSATGVDDLSKKLDNVSSSATKADNSINTFTADTTKSSTAAAKAGGAFSGFGSKAAQVGYQVQDMTVQLQAGTSAFTVIAQQVPQALGAFGPMGAIIGTVTALAAAVGGVLYKSMQDTAQSAEALKAAQKLLNQTMDEGSDGALHLSDAFYQLAASNEAAAKAQLTAAISAATAQMTNAGNEAAKATEKFDAFMLSFTGSGLEDAAKQLDRVTQAGASTADVAGMLSDRFTAANASVVDLYNYSNQLQESLGLTKDQSVQLTAALAEVEKTKSPEAIKALGSELTSLQDTNGRANSELNNFSNTVQQAIVQIQKGGDAVAFLQSKLRDLSGETERAKNRMAALGESYVANLEMQNKKGAELLKAQRDMQIEEIKNKEGIDDKQRARALAATEQHYQNELSDLKNSENKKTETHAAALQKREDTAQRHREREAERDKQAAERFVAQVERTSSDELANIDATETQRLKKLSEYHNKEIVDKETGNKRKLISDEQYIKLKSDIEKTADENRKKETDRRYAEELKKKTEHDQFMKEIGMSGSDPFSQLDATAQEQRSKADELYQNGSIKSYEEYQAALTRINENAALSRIKATGDEFGSMAANMGTAFGKASGAYKAFALTQATIATYTGAIEAYKSAAAIPVDGFALAPVAAAAAVAAGLANIAAIKSAREQGGSMSANSAYQMAERGKAEVIVPAGASRARTAAQMRDIMGQNSGGNQIRGVTIINNTTGRIDSAQTEVDNEDQLRVIIDEHVSNMLMTQDSRIAKARRASVGPGY